MKRARMDFREDPAFHKTAQGVSDSAISVAGFIACGVATIVALIEGHEWLALGFLSGSLLWAATYIAIRRY